MGNSEEGEGQSFRIEILDQFQLVFFPCAHKGNEITDYLGADEFFPFLLKAILGKEHDPCKKVPCLLRHGGP